MASGVIKSKADAQGDDRSSGIVTDTGVNPNVDYPYTLQTLGSLEKDSSVTFTIARDDRNNSYATDIRAKT